MQKLFSLGHLYPSDFLSKDEKPRSNPVELDLVLADDGVVKLGHRAPPEAMYGKRYWYRSSISETMKRQLRDIVGEVIDLTNLNDCFVWVDIAGNDGYLLSQVPNNLVRINVDPCDDSFKVEAAKKCDLVIQDYFSADVYKKSKFGHLKANVVSVISMFYDLYEPGIFLDDVNEIMDNDALLVLQLSYSPLMLKQLEFSNICHEHLCYYSFFNLKALFEKHNFQVMDVQLNNTNAGSFRVYAMKKSADTSKFASQTHRDVCDFRIQSLLHYEGILELDKPNIWMQFFERINELKELTVSFIKSQKVRGKTIMGYGASTKFNTTIQYFGLTNEMITAIADKSPAKHGLRTVGSDIPIISEQEMRRLQPDFLLVGPNHFLAEFKERERTYLERGGKIISIMPSFQIIEK